MECTECEDLQILTVSEGEMVSENQEFVMDDTDSWPPHSRSVIRTLTNPMRSSYHAISKRQLS